MQAIARSNILKIEKTTREKVFGMLSIILRVVAVLMLLISFIADLNPARIMEGPHGITIHLSLFTSGFTNTINRNIRHLFVGRLGGTIESSTAVLLRLSSIVTFIGILIVAIGSSLTLAGKRIRQAGAWLPIFGALLMFAGLAGILLGRNQILESPDYRVVPYMPIGIFVFFAFAIVSFLLAVAIRIATPNVERNAEKKHFFIPEKYKLVLYALPVIILAFLMAYLPLWGWRYAFFDVSAVGAIGRHNFVGFRWFRTVFADPSERADMLVVLRNTLVMSGLGIASSILPLLFAMFFAEIKSRNLGRIVQTFTTLPNFMSWTLIYAFAFTIFATQGVFNNIFGGNTNHLMASGPAVWFQMLGWGVWRSLGWSAIIYIAAITSIDQELYEAASIDGAKRFGKMWYITFPSLLPTFSVMLLLAFANMLSNGLEQYYVFANPFNRRHIRVLDLYVFQRGMGRGGESANIGLATVIGMLRTAISLVLLFAANFASKFIRGESII